MRVLLTGGGTAGSVSPLLAIVNKYSRLQQIKNRFQKSDFLWLGTKKGPEKRMVKDYNIKFKAITSGKFRRYFDLRNFLDVFKILAGFFQSIFIILKFRPDIILSAGSFVSVPVVWAGWLLRKKSLIHQQDVRPGLANKLMVPFATRITVTFEESIKHFPKKKTVWTGNPLREEILKGSKERVVQKFGLEGGVPVLLVMGGGTGSTTINRIVAEVLSQLTKFCQVVHLTGAQKHKNTKTRERYYVVDFLTVGGMADVYACADVVVSRCGMGSLTELSVLGKPTIFIPLADTHQEDNAKFILDKEAGVIIWQRELTREKLVATVDNLLDKKEKYEDNISGLIKDGTDNIVNEIEQI